jgi:hypothetical protein
VPGATGFVELFRVTGAPLDGNLIAVDFYAADGDNDSVYAVTDTGKIYTTDPTGGALGKATLISAMNPRSPSGYQSLMDFNPVR